MDDFIAGLIGSLLSWRILLVAAITLVVGLVVLCL
jgi:hypothetical protein